MDPVSYLFRLLHILPAVFLGGGVLFMWSSLLPGTQGLDPETKKAVADGVRAKWAKIVMICSGLLLLTGLYNAVANIKAYEYELPYHAFVLVKLILGLAIMFISARLAGKSASAEKFRENAAFWATINAVLVILLIASASVMKVMDKTPKAADEETTTAMVAVDVEQPQLERF